MFFNTKLLDTLSSPRLRMHYDLRNSEGDQSQRMLNAIEPGTVIEEHRHTGTSKTVAVLHGVAEEVFYNDDGNEIGRYRLMPGGAEPGSFATIQVPMGQYHRIEFVMCETTACPYWRENGKINVMSHEQPNGNENNGQ